MDKSLHYLAMANQQLIQKQLLERVKSAGLTLGQPKVLDFLKDHDGASQKDIAAGCFIEAASLTSILNVMEKKGLITLICQPGNKKNKYIHLTEAGEKIMEEIAVPLTEAEKEAFSALTQEEQDLLLPLLQKHANALKAAVEKIHRPKDAH